MNVGSAEFNEFAILKMCEKEREDLYDIMRLQKNKLLNEK